MNQIEALHHAARQYCIERAALWRGRYSKLDFAGRATTPEAYDVFPRYLTLAAIQNEIERFLPADFGSLEEGRSLIALAGETANSLFTQQTDATAIAADLDERKQFIHFVCNLDQSQLLEQQRLPYRRVLGAMEHSALHEAVAQKWGKWYGGYSDMITPASEIVTLHDAAMDDPESYPRLRAALTKNGVYHVLELREYGDGFEIPIESADFTYNGAEGFWTSNDLGWLVYASHESSITFGGHWLVEEMRAGLPEFERYIYKGWDRATYA